MEFFYIIGSIGESGYLSCCRGVDLELLELLGTEYLIEHIISEHQKEVHKKAYWSYTADILKALAESMGVEVERRYADIISNKPVDNRTGDEIALDVITRAGLKVKNDDTV